MKLDIQKFAVTKSTTFKESNISIADNTSTLTITIEFSPNNNETYFSSKTLNCTCNGKTLSKSVSLSKGGSVKTSFVFNGIKHNADGTKTVSWNWSCATGTSILGTISASGTRTLQTINRYGRVTSTSGNTTNSTITVTYESYNANYTYDLIIYQNFDLPAYQEIDNIASSVGSHNLNITIGNDYFNIYPNQTTAQIYYVLSTHIDENTINDETYTTSINLNSNVIPGMTISALSEGNETISDLGWNVFVQNKSKLVYDIIGYGVNNSTISSYISSVEGNRYTTSHVEANLVNAGSESVLAQVTDSRGRTSPIDISNYVVYAYSNPSITIAQAQRCNQDGTLNEEGRYILFSIQGSISSINNNNDAYFKISYKRTIDDNYTDVTLSTNYTINQANVVSSFTISPDYSYDIKFSATDSFTSTSIVRTLGVGFDLLNFNPSGNAMAIGKVSEATGNDRLLEIALATDITNDVTINGDLTMVGDINGTNFALNSDVFYSSGDIVEIGSNYYITSGFVTSSTKSVRVTVITPKRLDNITTITCNSLNVEARTANGYLNNETGYHEFVGRSGYTGVNCSKASDNAITVTIEKNTAYSNVTNNTYVVLNGYFKFTLS